jgi:hypothetical protein
MRAQHPIEHTATIVPRCPDDSVLGVYIFSNVAYVLYLYTFYMYVRMVDYPLKLWFGHTLALYCLRRKNHKHMHMLMHIYIYIYIYIYVFIYTYGSVWLNVLQPPLL